jgi:hypothetical protein
MALADAGASSISVTGRGALNQGLRKLTTISSCSTFHNSRSRAIVGRLLLTNNNTLTTQNQMR